MIVRSGLFDAHYYLRQYGNDPSICAAPLDHFLTVGEAAGFKPNFLFEPNWYREHAMVASESAASPLVHYILIGSRAGLSPGPQFNPRDYLDANADVAQSGSEPLAHFLKFGAAEGRRRSNATGAGRWFGIAAVSNLGRRSGSGATVHVTHFCRPPSANAGSILHVMHMAGGGTERAVAARVVNSSPGEHHIVLMVEQSAEHFELSFVVQTDDQPRRLDLTLSDARELEIAISGLKLARVVVHQPLALVLDLRALLRALAVPFDVVVHDYSLLCPRSSFVKASGEYCGEPRESGCRSCLKSKPLVRADEINPWRSEGVLIFGAADRVECPLEDVARRVRHYVPNARTHVRSLDVPKVRAYNRRTLSRNERLRVAVLGHCSTAKGGEFLLDCVYEAENSKRLVDWSVVGSLAGVKWKRFKRVRKSILVTGDYDVKNLDDLLLEVDPHLIFFPQHCVETWSFALSEALASGRAILAPDLGAFGERLTGVAGATLYSVSDSPSNVLDRISKIRDSLVFGEGDLLHRH